MRIARLRRIRRPGRASYVRDRAYRLCGQCGLVRAEIDGLIDTMRHLTLTRQQNLELFYKQFRRREDAKLCEPCAIAVLNTAD